MRRMRQWRISWGARRKNAPFGALMGGADPGRTVFPIAGGGPDVKASILFPDPFCQILLSPVTSGHSRPMMR